MPDWRKVAIIALGLACLAFALVGQGLPRGAGLFPAVVGWLGAVTAGLCLILLRRGEAGGEGEEEGAAISGATYRAVVLALLCPLVIVLLGYVPGTIAFVVALLGWRRENRKALLGLAGLTVLLWFVFAQLLLLRLPQGLVWSILGG